jgi:hypothetical protein
VSSKIGRSSALSARQGQENSRVERRITESRRGFLIGSASLLAAPAIARADQLVPVKIVESSCGTTITIMDVLRTVRNKTLRHMLSTTHLEALLRNDMCLYDELSCRVGSEDCDWLNQARYERRCSTIDNYWLRMLTLRDMQAGKCLGFISRFASVRNIAAADT